MSLYLRKVGRAPLWLAWKVPAVAKAAKGAGKALKLVSRGWYHPGLTIDAYALARALHGISMPVLISAANGRFYLKTADRTLADNPLDDISPDVLRLNFSFPEELATLFRQMKKSILRHQRKHGEAAVWRKAVIPAVVNRAKTTAELKVLLGLVEKLSDGYVAGFASSQINPAPSLPYYLGTFPAVFYNAGKTEEADRKAQRLSPEKSLAAFIETVLKLDKEYVNLITSYIRDYGDPLPFNKLILPGLIKKGQGIPAWGKAVLSSLHALSARYGKLPGYLELLAVVLADSRRGEDFQRDIASLDSLLAARQTLFSTRPGTLLCYIRVLSFLWGNQHYRPAISEWLKIIDSASAAFTGQNENLPDFFSKIILPILGKKPSLEQFKAWVEKNFPGSTAGAKPVHPAEPSPARLTDHPFDPLPGGGRKRTR